MERWFRRFILGAWMNVGWSLDKEARNRAKPGVGFTEAITAFDDPGAVSAPHHEDDEERNWLIGRSDSGRLLFVVVSAILPEGGGSEDIGSLRVISARRATPKEEARYRHDHA